MGLKLQTLGLPTCILSFVKVTKWGLGKFLLRGLRMRPEGRRPTGLIVTMVHCNVINHLQK